VVGHLQVAWTLESDDPVSGFPGLSTDRIVEAGCQNVAGEGKIAMLSGIQINTPETESDYFLPLNFEIRDNKNKRIQDLMWK